MPGTATVYTTPDFGAPPLVDAPLATFVPLAKDGVLPEGFFSTSNLPTYVHLDAGWVMPSRPRMDCAILRRGDTLETIEPRKLVVGDLVAIGLAEDGTEGVLTDALDAQDAMREHTIKATGAIFVATALHAIAVGQTEFVVGKLKDRGTHQAYGVVTNAQDFMYVLRQFTKSCIQS